MSEIVSLPVLPEGSGGAPVRDSTKTIEEQIDEVVTAIAKNGELYWQEWHSGGKTANEHTECQLRLTKRNQSLVAQLTQLRKRRAAAHVASRTLARLRGL